MIDATYSSIIILFVSERCHTYSSGQTCYITIVQRFAA